MFPVHATGGCSRPCSLGGIAWPTKGSWAHARSSGVPGGDHDGQPFADRACPRSSGLGDSPLDRAGIECGDGGAGLCGRGGVQLLACIRFSGGQWSPNERSRRKSPTRRSRALSRAFLALECRDDGLRRLLVRPRDIEVPDMAVGEVQRQVRNHLPLVKVDRR
jgi:hypothetical protein